VHVGDILLGSVGRAIPPSENLNHAVRLLGSASGVDRAFMLLQYTAKLLIPLLEWRARVGSKGGNGKASVSHSVAAVSLARLASKIADARTLWRLWGLPPIFTWASSIERNSPASKTIQTIERLQALSMLVYYPLEHTYYLASHKIIRLPRTLPFSSQKAPLNVQDVIGKLALWSTRAWAVYVVLQLYRLKIDWDILHAQRRKERQEVDKYDVEAVQKGRAEFAKKKDAIFNEAAINLAYLPLTAHWSLKSGLYKNEIWTSILGMAAAVYSFRMSWKATALAASV